MSRRKRLLKIVLSAFLCFAATGVMVGSCLAGQFYPNGKAECLAASGRADIPSVQWACGKAVAKSQNACATWIGPTDSSTSRVIVASALTGTVAINFWGMCTDRADTASALMVEYDGDSIRDRISNFTRSGVWGSPSAMGTTLDVAKFINGASIVNGMYYRRVYIGRCHSNYGVTRSCSADWSDIYLSVGGTPPPPVPDDPEVLCKRWAPRGFTGANKWHGTTTVDIRIKNLASRFGNTGYGTWNKGTIYAMPTDEVQWIECYFGGTPGTGHTEVSSINGGQKTYVDLRDDWCHNSSSGSVWVPEAGYYPYKNVGSTALSVPYYELWSQSPVWQNQWQIWGSGEVRKTGDSANGSWSFDVFTNKSDAKRNGYLTMEGHAGQTFTEYGQTGAPQSVSISGSNPTATINKSYYYTWEENPNDPKTCSVSNPSYDPSTPGSSPTISVTSGALCGYNKTLKVDHFDGYSCTNKYERTLYNATVNYSPHDDDASVKVPYNFTTFTGVELAKGEVYSGETVEVSNVWTIVGPKDNAVTKATYATQVPSAKLKLYAYVTADEDGGDIGEEVTSNSNACNLLGSTAKQCLEFKSKSGFTLNSSGSLAGGDIEEWDEMGGTYNAFDAAAGDYMCFVSLVYPATSGSDTQMGTGGDGKWRYSEPTCAIISKKPTFQVWGGSLYSVGSISTNISEKRNIYKDYIGNIKNKFKKTGGSVIKFGPWVEESLVMKTGTTKTVASGAGSGLSGTAAGVGSTNELCNGRANLSFANYSTTLGGPCNNNNMVGQSGIDSGIKDREELIDYWVGAAGGPTNTSGGSYNLGNLVGDEITTATGVKVRYLNSSGELTLSGTVRQGTTYLIKSAGTVTISNNLKYNTGTYNTFGSVPKVVIYAKNVNIKCGVKEVDAIIVTANGGTVNTCSEFPDNTSEFNNLTRSKQLRIFGMVITDKIILGRTYGAAANEDGKKTDSYGIPSDGAAAEIFDYDSSTLIWSEYMAGSAETDTLQTVYQHELAPRY